MVILPTLYLDNGLAIQGHLYWHKKQFYAPAINLIRPNKNHSDMFIEDDTFIGSAVELARQIPADLNEEEIIEWRDNCNKLITAMPFAMSLMYEFKKTHFPSSVIIT